MSFPRTLALAAMLAAVLSGHTGIAVASPVTATMIIADENNKDAARRDAMLAPKPTDRCSGCHRAILPFTHLPVSPDINLMGHNRTESNHEWKKTEAAALQWQNADEKVSWTKIMIYTRAKGKVKRIYAYEGPYQPTRFYQPAEKEIENPHRVLEE